MTAEFRRRAGRAFATLLAALAALGLAPTIVPASAQSYLVDNVKMSVSGTPGTGAITLGSAVAGAQSAAAAGVPNGAQVSYYISDGGTNWEIGHGTYSTSGPTLTRGALWSSAGANTAISLDSSAIVSLTLLAEDVGTAPTISIASPVSHSGGFSANGSGTYTTPIGVKWIEVKMVGGGGGGSGGNASASAGTGGNTTFGTSLLTAGGGTGGGISTNGLPATGGAATVNSPAVPIIVEPGGPGYLPAPISPPASTFSVSGAGCASVLAGVGGGSAANTPAPSSVGPGSGGGGGGGSSGQTAGGGGACGGYIDAIIIGPSSSYSFVVGTGGTAGSGTNTGNVGGSGEIIIEEHYGS